MASSSDSDLTKLDINSNGVANMENIFENSNNEESCSQSIANGKEKAKNFSFSDLSLEKIRLLHAEFSRERNWDQYHTPRNILLALVGEVGEVSELFQWRGETSVGLTNWNDKEKQAVGEELSDVLIYLIRLADVCKIDLSEAVLRKIDLNRKKYPVDKVYGSNKKYTEY